MLNVRCLGLRRVRNYATGFHNFYKIVPLRSVPHNQASGFLNGLCPGERTDRAGLCKAHKARLCELGANPRRLPRPEDLKYIINIFVWNKQNILKALIELQRYNQTKINPRWGMKPICWTCGVLDYVGFGTMQLGFTIFTKLFHSVQFLTIRRSGFTDGRSPGERKAGADKPEGRQAECFEREVNPRQW